MSQSIDARLRSLENRNAPPSGMQMVHEEVRRAIKDALENPAPDDVEVDDEHLAMFLDAACAGDEAGVDAAIERMMLSAAIADSLGNPNTKAEG